jgi:two-component system sensor kinase FixL
MNEPASRSLGGLTLASLAVLDAVPDAVVVVDGEGTVDHANPQVERLFGWPPSELRGQPIEALVPAAARAGHVALRAGFAKSPRVRPMGEALSVQGQRRDGTTFYADIQLSPAILDGRPVVLASVRDVTERHETRRRLEALGASLAHANAELEARNAELEQFAFAASHDLQEPLRKIVAFGDRLQKSLGDRLDERSRDYLGRMQGAATRMQQLIEALLRWSRLTTRAEPFTSMDLGVVVREVLDDLEVAIEKADATVHVGPMVTLDADPSQMRQLLQNLVGNALKYRDVQRSPEILVHAEIVEGDFVRVTVSDNGIGFEAKYAERIFDVFERLHGRTEYEGTGIGLAICRKIARRHGGEITATGEPGVGSTFVVTVPRSHAPSPESTS